MAMEQFDGVAVEQAKPTLPSHYPLWWSARLTYTICAFVSMIMQLCMRNTFNFAILCMVNTDEGDGTPNINISSIQSFDSQNLSNTTMDSQTNGKIGDIAWTRKQEFAIQATFYYGYVITLPVAGRLSDKFGGKILFIQSITIQAVLFMLIPYFSHISYTAAFTVRFLQGLVAGFSNPAIYQLFSTWAHQTERTALISFAYGGYSVGTLIAFPLSALLCQYYWELAFYAIGVSALLFGICCQWLVYNTLEEHPRLSTKEREYLKSTNAEKSKADSVPWKSILASKPVYAFTITHVFHSYGIIVFTLMLPRFLKEALGYSISESGIYSSVLFLGSVVSKIITVPVCSRIERKPNFNQTNFRKIFYVLCNFFTIQCLLIVILISGKHAIVIHLCILLFGIFTDMAFSSAYWPSLLHLTPSYAGLLSGIANCFATFNGFISPIVISALAVHGRKTEWNYVLLTLIASYVIAALAYGLFGSSKLQEWNNSESS